MKQGRFLFVFAFLLIAASVQAQAILPSKLSDLLIEFGAVTPAGDPKVCAFSAKYSFTANELKFALNGKPEVVFGSGDCVRKHLMHAGQEVRAELIECGALVDFSTECQLTQARFKLISHPSKKTIQGTYQTTRRKKLSKSCDVSERKRLESIAAKNDRTTDDLCP